MAETLEERQKVSRELEDIQNSLSAVIQKIARVQLETEQSSPELQETFDACVSAVGGAAEQMGTLRSDFEMETARRQNEGEL